MVRRWQVLGQCRGIPTDHADRLLSTSTEQAWSGTRLLEVGGDLPIAELPRFAGQRRSHQLLSCCEIEATTPGPIGLKPEVAPANAWHDATQSPPRACCGDPAQGKNVFTFAFV